MPESYVPPFISRQVESGEYFFLETASPAGDGNIVSCGGKEICRPDYVVQRDTFRFTAVELVMAGRGRLVLQGEPYDLYPGHIFSYGPGISHTIRSDHDASLHKLFIDFSGADLRAIMNRCGLAPGTVHHFLPLDEGVRLFDMMAEAADRRSGLTQEICISLLRVFLLKIGERVLLPAVSTGASYEAFRRCKRYIDTHYLKLASLQELARALGIHKSRICQYFRAFSHDTPHRYLQRKKIHYAAGLLSRANIPVKEVAYEVGLEDPFHFSKVFKKILGVSPKRFQEYRSRAMEAASRLHKP